MKNEEIIAINELKEEIKEIAIYCGKYESMMTINTNKTLYSFNNNKINFDKINNVLKENNAFSKKTIDALIVLILLAVDDEDIRVSKYHIRSNGIVDIEKS